MIEKVSFFSQIFETEILMDFYALRAPDSDNHIFSGWFVCLCLCICYPRSSKINYNRKFKFNILYLYYMLRIYYLFVSKVSNCNWKHFMTIGNKLCLQGHRKELFISAYGGNFLLGYFSIFGLH